MRNFLKHNFLVMLLLLCGYAAWSLASTITRPYSSADYAGGQKAVGAKVNAEFQNIVDWLNGGNIGSTNIATGGVATTNLADGSVTIDKIAGACCGYPIVTTSSSAFTMAGLVPVQVSNLSTTITTHGRGVYVGLEPNPGTYLLSGSQTYGSYIAALGNGTGIGANLFFVNNGATTAFYNIMTNTAGQNILYPCSAFHYTENLPAAGTYTFAVKLSENAGNSALGAQVFNCRLVVREEL
jgi:hypothetical protein